MIKRVSLTTLYVYIIGIVLCLAFGSDPELRSMSSGHSLTSGNFARGTVVYRPAGGVHFFGYTQALVEGTSEFVAEIPETGYSSNRIMSRIRAGEIELGEVDWKINWGAVLLAYVPIWSVVGFVYMLIFYGRRNPDDQTRSEQNAAHRPVPRV